MPSTWQNHQVLVLAWDLLFCHAGSFVFVSLCCSWLNTRLEWWKAAQYPHGLVSWFWAFCQSTSERVKGCFPVEHSFISWGNLPCHVVVFISLFTVFTELSMRSFDVGKLGLDVSCWKPILLWRPWTHHGKTEVNAKTDFMKAITALLLVGCSVATSR